MLGSLQLKLAKAETVRKGGGVVYAKREAKELPSQQEKALTARTFALVASESIDARGLAVVLPAAVRVRSTFVRLKASRQANLQRYYLLDTHSTTASLRAYCISKH